MQRGRWTAIQDKELVFNFQMGSPYMSDVVDLFKPKVIINLTGADGTLEEIAIGNEIPCLTFSLTEFHTVTMSARLASRQHSGSFLFF